jgi:hypothetical protein
MSRRPKSRAPKSSDVSPPIATFCWGVGRCLLRAVRPASRSQLNDGYNADSGRSRGNHCTHAIRPFETLLGTARYDRRRDPELPFQIRHMNGREARQSGLRPKASAGLGATHRKASCKRGGVGPLRTSSAVRLHWLTRRGSRVGPGQRASLLVRQRARPASASVRVRSSRPDGRTGDPPDGPSVDSPPISPSATVLCSTRRG